MAEIKRVRSEEQDDDDEKKTTTVDSGTTTCQSFQGQLTSPIPDGPSDPIPDGPSPSDPIQDGPSPSPSDPTPSGRHLRLPVERLPPVARWFQRLQLLC
ncbi:hypothetical protein BBO99_00007153 [Phytophthora kernoviae]|uniref:Uncharacterized protein n=2 Tax=Phytophthora kernoviae TaxID=325452 RepID=A0A3R7J4R3_9STRA|nr:hypothetical protein G195_008028 [Phytophthora kernoviae 00238/432]KAG2520388.1 hypothetical protein JM16_006405 [Phytophthora kernoviae]KAG2521415.1 hypothetical protein JM18_006624 [Phytophthora kernoviae]RLN31676.1 hypothetical protein BBI17_007112 [Phytophthora kernoviae]RLN76947.1 hypothetical protein BBO99_00007153 [Phytophthora kernoviae]